MSLLKPEDQEVFDKVDSIAKDLRSNALRSSTFKPINALSDWLNELTGCFMYLTTGFNRAKVGRDNNEVNSYIKSKTDTLATGDKFVSAVAEREARQSVNDFVELEKVFEGYRDAAEQGILTIKKLMEVQLLEMQREAR